MFLSRENFSNVLTTQEPRDTNKPAMNNSLHHPITKAVVPLIGGICKYKSHLEVKEQVNSGVTIFLLPHMADYPKVCGSGGRQIKALRFLVKRMGNILGIKAFIDLKESWIGDREDDIPFVRNPDFDEQQAIELLDGFRHLLWPQGFENQKISALIEGDKMHIYLMPNSDSDVVTINALADVFYTYGYANGRKIVIHDGPENNEHRTIRQSPIPGGERERT
jgi:predicted RNA-binding protein YlqC (UPF0109 family)